MISNPAPPSVRVTHYRIVVHEKGGKRYACCPHGVGQQTGVRQPVMKLVSETNEATHFPADERLVHLLLLTDTYFAGSAISLDPVCCE
jgi:hypothetical protein